MKLRGRTTTPDERRGRTLSPGARGAKQTAPHGPLQRLLERTQISVCMVQSILTDFIPTNSSFAPQAMVLGTGSKQYLGMNP